VKRLVIALLGTLLLTAVPARADVLDDNPAAVSRGPGDIVVVARGADGAIYERHLEGGNWTAWSSIGGVTTSGPAAAAYGDSIHVFALGTRYGVHENVLRAGTWSGWTALGGAGTSAPAAVARRGTNLLDLAVRSTNNGIYLKTFQPGSGWTPWSGLGGNLSSAPSLESQHDGYLNVFARGSDGSLYQRAWNGTAWRGWESRGGGLIGAPSAIARRADAVDIFVRGAASGLWQKSWTNTTSWIDWHVLDARPLDSTPAAVSDTEGHIVLFARSGASILVKEWRAGVGWSAWSDWGPVAPPPPPAPPPAPAPPPPPPPRDGLARLQTGVRCTPPGGRLKVSLKIHKRSGAAKPRVRRVVFFVRNGPRRTDHHAPFVARLRLNRPAGSRGRVYARAFYTRKASRKVRHRTVSRAFVMCG
jgi:hypothetical protein